MRTAVRALTLLSVALLVTASFAGTVTAHHEDEYQAQLEDGEYYYRGTTLIGDGFEPGATYVLQTDSGSHVRDITADSNGKVAINTDNLVGRHHLTDNGTVLYEFNSRKYVLDPAVSIETADGGNSKYAVVEFNMVTDATVKLSSTDIDLSDRVENAESTSGGVLVSGDSAEIDVSDLTDGNYDLTVNPQDAPAHEDATIKLDSSSSETKSYPDTEQLVGGGEYWKPATLLFEYPSDKMFVVHNADTGGYVFEGRTEDGQYVFETESWKPATYNISNSSTDEEILAFELQAQTLNATLTNETVNVSSNRADYDLTLWAEGLNRSQLLEFVPAATTNNNGDVVLNEVSKNVSADLATDTVDDGNYTLHLAANDTDANATVIVEVQSSSSTSDTSSGSLEATTTATPTETETATSTATSTSTATEAPTATSTPAPTDGGVSPTDAAGAGAATVGLGGAALLARKYAS